MQSIAQDSPPAAVSLREIAAQAWERQQAEAAERHRQEIADAHDRMVNEIHRSLRGFTDTYDPFSPLTDADILAAQIKLIETADGIPFAATITFAGERFLYHPMPHGGQALRHRYLCPICNAQHESDSHIGSLADLGYWLEQASTRCYHGGDL